MLIITVNTYLRTHLEVRRFCVQKEHNVSICERNNQDDINAYGRLKIIEIAEPQNDDELLTLIVGDASVLI